MSTKYHYSTSVKALTTVSGIINSMIETIIGIVVFFIVCIGVLSLLGVILPDPDGESDEHLGSGVYIRKDGTIYGPDDNEEFIP